MKIILLCLILLFTFTLLSDAQSVMNQANIWYFNFNCGVDFSSGSPVTLNNSALYTNEGSTSICDSNSNLLFYTNGVSVYNASHATMVNGTGLYGGQSSSQSCIAVPQPGSNTIWYLFTTAQMAGTEGARYSIIDMSLQSGLGEVTMKNIPLVTLVEEKVTATLQENGTDYWILFHGYGNNNYYAYPLTSAGIGSCVITSTGSSGNDWPGCMKFSPDGNKIADAIYWGHSFQVFDFNKSSGVVTYGFTIPFDNTFPSYGVEWSRDSRHLFMSNVNLDGKIYEADMSLPDTTSIINSATLIESAPGEVFGSLQMGPDGKIYLVRYNNYNLGVINYPDSLGAACDYSGNGISTSPNNNWLGLPNYITSWFAVNDEPAPSPVAFNASDTDICENICINFYDSSLNNPVAWLWYFPGGDPATSNEHNPTNICYNSPGIYDVTVITTNAGGSDTLTLSNYITVYSNPVTPVITQTGNTLISSSATSYQWQFNSVDIPGATNQSYTITQSGLYTVISGDDHGCTSQASVDASYVGIALIAGNSFINVYPNPASDELIVEWSGGFASSEIGNEITISLLNSVGQIVFSSRQTIPFTNQKKKFDLENVASGIYFIGIKSENFTDFIRMKDKIIITK